MKKVDARNICILVLACGLAVAPAWADVLELKDGRVLTGKYVGGTAGSIRFETAGNVQVVEIGKVLALTFTEVVAQAPVPATPAPAEKSEAAPTPAAASDTVTVPVRTVLLVRMIDGVSSKSPQGKRFASVLETDLVVNNIMVAKAGTKVYGCVEKASQAGRFAGKSVLDLRLSELTVGGKLVPIITGPFAQTGSQSLGKTAKGALAGAAIGALSGGSDSAGKGAAIGALASGLKPGQPIVVSPGTLLEFEIQQTVTLNITP
ncbi:MAG: hypothetical protein WCS52_09885 [bacterium]